MTEAGDEFAAQANGALAQLIPVAAGMGVQFTAVRRGFVQATVPIEGNANHFGVVYAGVIFTVAEVLGGAMHLGTFDVSTHYPLVKSVEIDFLAPGTSRLTATASLPDAEVERMAAAVAAGAKVPFVLEAEVVGADGTPVARSRGDYQLRPFGA